MADGPPDAAAMKTREDPGRTREEPARLIQFS